MNDDRNVMECDFVVALARLPYDAEDDAWVRLKLCIANRVRVAVGGKRGMWNRI